MIYTLIVFVLPLCIGYALQRVTRAGGALKLTGLALAASGVPILFMFVMSQRADAVTRAAAWTVLPLFWLFLTIPAAIGVHLADMREIRK